MVSTIERVPMVSTLERVPMVSTLERVLIVLFIILMYTSGDSNSPFSIVKYSLIHVVPNVLCSENIR